MIPLGEQMDCVRRELAMRQRAYPRWVANGKMTQRAADVEVARMSAVLMTLEGLAEKERLL
jgi:hypothetical protein